MPHRTLEATLRRLCGVLALAALAGCVPHVGPRTGPAGPPEARSLFDQPLYPPELPLEQRQRLEAQLDSARQSYESNPDNADAILLYGRRLAALGQYREAIALFTEGMRKHPSDARFYLERGHRWITVRQFDRAGADLEHAARLVRGRPDQPEQDDGSAGGQPLATQQWSIWYHLGIAYYLRGEFVRAAPAFRAALGLARNDDTRAAAADWLYMSLRRQNRPAEAAAVLAELPATMTVTESLPYWERIRLYRGQLPPDSLLGTSGRTNQDVATLGYGVGNWYLYNGRPSDAEAVFWKVTSAENWAPFGYIAAEADLRRITRDEAQRAP